MRAPVVEIDDILGQDLLKMALIEYEHVVQALRPDRSHPALGDGVGPRRSERRASLGNTEITHSPIEGGAITAVPAAAFNNLLCRPVGGRMRRHVHVENLPTGVMNPRRTRVASET
jgi:hypothetical protein